MKKACQCLLSAYLFIRHKADWNLYQVLIVMLQKEQGLVLDSWPVGQQYAAAMGQACPDTAPCDPSFAGFFAQVYGGARQMKIYLEGVYFTWYAPGRTWNILYNPNEGCGSSPVRIENAATSALYYYTPYQPNAAALSAGYGTGNSCSAYGNRNFFNFFTDWFGSTQGTVPAATANPVLSGTANTGATLSVSRTMAIATTAPAAAPIICRHHRDGEAHHAVNHLPGGHTTE